MQLSETKYFLISFAAITVICAIIYIIPKKKTVKYEATATAALTLFLLSIFLWIFWIGGVVNAAYH